MEPKIVFEGEDLLVLDKPSGMTVNRADTTKGEKTVQDFIEQNLKILNKSQIPNPNVQNNLEFRDSNLEFGNRAGIVHRLDKETSGVLVVAKTPEAFSELQRQFKERIVKKAYLALVHGKVEPETGEIRVPIGRLPWNRKRFGVVALGREAVTKYKIVRYYDTKILGNETFTLLELYPETGRTHQIRVHMKYAGHPVVSDELYAGRKTARNDRKLLARLFLHATKLTLNHPKNGKPQTFESELPKQLKDFLELISRA